MSEETTKLYVPNAETYIYPDNKVKLGRFDPVYWIVGFDWYSWGGNRAVCGWYLKRESDSLIKPIYQTDLDDMYVIEG